mmetsp:Transcript_16544/g.24324  ORF Transcript_16544/g.24324 Transcript_16544/m.24324 type:complete len:238 (-) Transcript_16544:228-941(-)
MAPTACVLLVAKSTRESLATFSMSTSVMSRVMVSFTLAAFITSAMAPTCWALRCCSLLGYSAARPPAFSSSTPSSTLCLCLSASANFSLMLLILKFLSWQASIESSSSSWSSCTSSQEYWRAKAWRSWPWPGRLSRATFIRSQRSLVSCMLALSCTMQVSSSWATTISMATRLALALMAHSISSRRAASSILSLTSSMLSSRFSSFLTWAFFEVRAKSRSASNTFICSLSRRSSFSM